MREQRYDLERLHDHFTPGSIEESPDEDPLKEQDGIELSASVTSEIVEVSEPLPAKIWRRILPSW
ncbi:MAG: hypothetical protein PVS3B1_30070 [Ktedonobacteraceae bacterium]